MFFHATLQQLKGLTNLLLKSIYPSGCKKNLYLLKIVIPKIYIKQITPFIIFYIYNLFGLNVLWLSYHIIYCFTSFQGKGREWGASAWVQLAEQLAVRYSRWPSLMTCDLLWPVECSRNGLLFLSLGLKRLCTLSFALLEPPCEKAQAAY